MDKRSLVEQLASRLLETALVARRAGEAAFEEAREGATASEKRESARTALEWGGLARGQSRRADRAMADLAALERFRPATLAPSAPVQVGAVVEVESETGEGRTFFLAPVGAGVELTGPDGDGFLSVVTPLSPIGRAVLGHRVGAEIEVTVDGHTREWTITWVE